MKAKRVAAGGPVDGPWTLPDGWRWERLGDVCEPSQYGWTTKAASSGTTRFLRTTDISSGRVDWGSVPFCAEQPSDLERYRVKSGDILISRAGSVGKSFLIESADEAVFASYLIRFRPLTVPRYIYYWLQTGTYWSMISENTAGIAIPNVNATKLSELPVPMAPDELRGGIVARVDELFAEIDDGEAALARAGEDLATWRKALLKAAVTGELTAEWRASHQIKPIGTDPFSTEAAGDLPVLPEGWTWTTIAKLGRVSGGITKNAKRSSLDRQVSYLRVANVHANRLVLDRIETIGVTPLEFTRTELKEGDLLIVEGNGSIDQIGRSAVWDGSIPSCVHQNHLIKVRFEAPLLPAWVQAWLQSPHGRRELEAKASSTSGLHTLSISKVQALRCPLPPIPEIDEALFQLKRLQDDAVAGEDDFQAARSDAAGLRQSVLSAAFRGELTA